MKTRVNGVAFYTLYNVEKKEPIAIFAGLSFANRYLFDIHTESNYNKIWYAHRSKRKIRTDLFDFSVCLRTANDIQIKLLNGLDWYIYPGYPPPREVKMLGFKDNRNTLWKRHYKEKKKKNENEKDNS